MDNKLAVSNFKFKDLMVGDVLYLHPNSVPPKGVVTSVNNEYGYKVSFRTPGGKSYGLSRNIFLYAIVRVDRNGKTVYAKKISSDRRYSMPYDINNPPDKIRNLSEKKQRQWIEVFNSCWDKHQDDATCHAMAWGVVKKSSIKTHNGPWETNRSCRAQDLIYIDQGLQCSNCGAVTQDHMRTWIDPVTRKRISKTLTGMDFPSQDALKKYLKEHPNADKKRHTVTENKRKDESMNELQKVHDKLLQQGFPDSAKKVKKFMRTQLNPKNPMRLHKNSEIKNSSFKEKSNMNRVLIAKELVKISRLLMGMEFLTQDSLDKYLKEHPDADKSLHTVKKTQEKQKEFDLRTKKTTPSQKMSPHKKAPIRKETMLRVQDILKQHDLSNESDELKELAGFKKTLGQRVPESKIKEYFVRNKQQLKSDFIKHMDSSNYKTPEAFQSAKRRMQAMPVQDFAKILAAINAADEE